MKTNYDGASFQRLFAVDSHKINLTSKGIDPTSLDSRIKREKKSFGIKIRNGMGLVRSYSSSISNSTYRPHSVLCKTENVFPFLTKFSSVFNIA